jgi:HD superfamily phosphohydrolase YqeK
LPPGVGKFLIKSGQRPGIPVHVDLTQAELAAAVHDTNKRWAATALVTATPAAVPAQAVRGSV